MQRLAELDLPYLPVMDPEFGEDPMRHFLAAKQQHPWLAKTDIGYFVHDFRAIRDLMNDDDRLRPGYEGIVEHFGAQGTPWGRFTEHQMISLPVEQHKLLRHAFAHKFTPRFANRLRPSMRATIGRLLDEWAPRKRFDFAEFASWFPISVMFSIVGAPVEEVAGIRTDLETLGLAMSMDRARLPAMQEAICNLDELVQRVIGERRADPNSKDKDDLLTLLIETGDEGRIGERELADLIMFFFIAGYDTSKNVLAYMLWLMIDHPDIYRRCAADLDYCGRVVEEALRIFNPGSIGRLTNQEIVYRDVILAKDTMLFFALNISGRDPAAFERPETFDPDRKLAKDQRHVAFGLGKHMCLGQYIARVQLQEAIHRVAQRLPDPKLDGEIRWRPYPGAWGLETLPVRFG